MKMVDGVCMLQGTTNEEVLAMLIDRLYWLQKKLSCRENAIVITKLEEALMWLNRRTYLRILQQVEQTEQAHKSEGSWDESDEHGR
jgi:predicted metal-dependent hydrolase